MSQVCKESEVLFTGRIFRVVKVIQQLPDGSTLMREVVRHPGAVVVLPLLDDGRVCLVRNFRPAVGQTLVELPAGTLEPDEDPLDTARRELAEETGYRAGRVEHLLSFYMSPGILDERMHVFVATGLTPGEQSLETGEQLEPLLLPLEEALAMARDGRIQDAKTLVALFYYRLFSRPVVSASDMKL